MDTPATESNAPLNEFSAADAFAQILDPQEVPKEEEAPKAETPAEHSEVQEEPADETITIEVDGKNVEVKKSELPDLYKNGLRQADYTRKTMEAAETRKTAEAEAQKARQERATYAQNLQRMQAQLEGALQEQEKTDWEALLRTDPTEYLRQQHLAQKRQAQLMQVRQEQQKVHAQFEAERQQDLQRHLTEQAQALLDKLPEWKDETKAQAEKASIKKYLLDNGFSKDAVENVTDANAVVLARKAMLYDQMLSKAQVAAKKVSTLPTKVEKPGTGEAPGLDRRTSAFQKLSKSGKVEDAAAVFSSLL